MGQSLVVTGGGVGSRKQKEIRWEWERRVARLGNGRRRYDKKRKRELKASRVQGGGFDCEGERIREGAEHGQGTRV